MNNPPIKKDENALESLEIIFQRALQAHQQNRLDEAIEGYDSVLSQSPAQLDVSYLLGTAHLQKGDFETAYQLLCNVHSSRPDSADLCNNLGITCKALGDKEQAIHYLKESLRVDPGYTQGRYNLAQLLYETGAFTEAISIIAELSEKSNLGESGTEETTSAPQWQILQGKIYLAMEDYSTSEKYFKSGGSKHPEDLKYLAYALAKQEKNREASTIYQAFLKRYPDDLQALVSQSYVLERDGQLEPALAVAEAAVKAHPDSPEAYNNLGNAYRSLHAWDDALNAFTKAISLKPDFSLSIFNRASLLLSMGDYKNGWQGYEHRLNITQQSLVTPKSPVWEGGKITGKTLLLCMDQGLGDTVQFARFFFTSTTA